MSTAPVDPSYASHGNEIHLSTVFDGKTPALCGASGVPCPAASEWRYVSCPACLAGMVHGRRASNDNALCGAVAGAGGSTTRRSRVQCPACVEEIERRLAKVNEAAQGPFAGDSRLGYSGSDSASILWTVERMSCASASAVLSAVLAPMPFT